MQTSREALEDVRLPASVIDHRRRRDRRRVRLRLRELRGAGHDRRDGADVAARHGRRPGPRAGAGILEAAHGGADGPSLRSGSSARRPGRRSRSRGPAEPRTLAAERVLVAVGRTPLTEKLRPRGSPGPDGSRLRRGRRDDADDRRWRLRHRRSGGAAPARAHRVRAGRDRGGGDWRIDVTGRGACDVTRVPMCVYCQPEVAAVGLTEAEARARGEVRVGKFPFRALGKAMATGHTTGFVKVVARRAVRRDPRRPHDRPRCDRARRRGAAWRGRSRRRRDELRDTSHAHPTLAEALREAALAADGEAINI